MNTQGSQVSILKTKALSQLNRAEVTVAYKAPASGADSKNIWAPELHFLNNKWYIYYTAGSSGDLSTQRMFVLENSNADPTKGAWVVKGQVKDNNADFFAIDATVFSNNGKNYIIWSGHISATDNTQRLYIAQLADEPWKMATPRAEISTPTYDWEKIGSPHVNEGPEILTNKNGRTFLIFSASGCWTDDYSLGMISLKENGDPLKPADWAKTDKPVFTKKPESGAYGPGHNSFFKSPDGTEDWILYHANPRAGLACSNDRSPRMQKFSWNADGTPNFGEPVKIDTPILKPSGE
jgi:GH43 family beta-xylosidase